MNNAPQPVYTGKVVTATGRDRLGIFFTACWPADKIAEKRAAKEAAGDTITFVGKPRPALPGEVPAATAKTLQQERSEKAAAKLASANQQRGTKREATKAKRALIEPAVQVKPQYVKPANSRAPRPIVNLSKGTYHPSRSAAERDNNTGENNIQHKLQQRHPARVQGDIYDYATRDEAAAEKCLRVVTDEIAAKVDRPVPIKPMGARKQRQYRPIVNLSTGAYYVSQGEADRKLGCFRDHVRRTFRRHGDADTVRVLGNVLSYATELEVKRGRCLRSLVLMPPKRAVSLVAGRAVICLKDKKVYTSGHESARKCRFGPWRLANLLEGEVRQTPAGSFRRATEQEIQQWKQAHGGQMQIAFNQSR